jgi:hypothetical protein
MAAFKRKAGNKQHMYLQIISNAHENGQKELKNVKIGQKTVKK